MCHTHIGTIIIMIYIHLVYKNGIAPKFAPTKLQFNKKGLLHEAEVVVGYSSSKGTPMFTIKIYNNFVNS